MNPYSDGINQEHLLAIHNLSPDAAYFPHHPLHRNPISQEFTLHPNQPKSMPTSPIPPPSRILPNRTTFMTPQPYGPGNRYSVPHQHAGAELQSTYPQVGTSDSSGDLFLQSSKFIFESYVNNSAHQPLSGSNSSLHNSGHNSGGLQSPLDSNNPLRAKIFSHKDEGIQGNHTQFQPIHYVQNPLSQPLGSKPINSPKSSNSVARKFSPLQQPNLFSKPPSRTALGLNLSPRAEHHYSASPLGYQQPQDSMLEYFAQ